MILLRFLLLILFTFSCNSQSVREEIVVGKTIKIQATNFPTTENTYTYKWTKPRGPIGNKALYQVEKNKMLFTPDKEGEYDIILLVESFDNTQLYEETFLYNAINLNVEKKTKVQKKSKPKKKVKTVSNVKNDDTTPKTKETITKNSYTIQVASWPSIEQASKHQSELSALGYDAYIQEFYMKNKNQKWWRVRVGHFTDKAKAEEIKTKLSKKTGTKLWIDFISE